MSLWIVRLGSGQLAELEEQFERLGDAIGVVGGEQVEQQPAGDGHAQPCSCPRGPRVESAVGYGRGERLEPAGHHTFEEAFCTWPTAQGVRVQLEEQPFLRPQFWIAVPCPEPT